MVDAKDAQSAKRRAQTNSARDSIAQITPRARPTSAKLIRVAIQSLRENVLGD